jgi:hypothetical protein
MSEHAAQTPELEMATGELQQGSGEAAARGGGGSPLPPAPAHIVAAASGLIMGLAGFIAVQSQTLNPKIQSLKTLEPSDP